MPLGADRFSFTPGGDAVIPLQAGRPRAAASRPADRPSDPQVPVDRGEGHIDDLPANGPASAELEAVLEPMLGAIVRMAGANAGIVRVIGGDGSCYEPVVATGIPGVAGSHGAHALAAWCETCAESRDIRSECVTSKLCGHDERMARDVLGPVCKHIVAVPLRHKDHPVGTLNLMFETERALPAAMTPLLQATGDLLGMTLDNARLARENLRTCLTNERHMMANEVHDSLAQGLTYMRMRMSLLRDAIRRDDELRAHKFWSDVDDTLGNSQRRLRELITYFRSRMDPQGLLHALSETSERFLDRTGIALEFVNRVPDLCLPPEREIEVFHIVQEALANVCRHAHARTATVVLAREGDGYVIVIEDDGVGMTAYPPAGDQDEPGHYGIAIMQERARRLGGKLVLGAVTSGTRLELHFPAAPVQDETPS
jgi:two-component system nitrate/nitrite sensor histidine kinase NarX